jgi:hypothetical protein
MSVTARRMQMAASNAGGAAEITDYTYVNYTTGGAAQQITMSSSAQAGDIAIGYTSGVGGSSTATWNGFTYITGISSTFDDVLQYRIVQSGDAGSTFTNSNSTSYDVCALHIIRPDIPAATVTVSDINNSGQTGRTPSSQILNTPETVPRLLVSVGAAYTSSSIFVLGHNGFEYNTGSIYYDNSLAKMYMTVQIQNTTVENRSISMSDYGSYNRLVSCIITAEP